MSEPSALHLLERAAHAGVWSWEPGGGHIESTPGLRSVLGLDAGAAPLALTQILDRLRTDSREKLAAAVGQCCVDAKRWDFEVELQGARGIAGRTLRTLGEARTEDGRIVALRGAFIDAQAGRRAQGQAQEVSERRRHALADPHCILSAVVSPDGRLLEASDAAVALSGLSREALLGQRLWLTPWWAYSGDIQMHLHGSLRSAAAGETVRYEVEIMGTDGPLAIDLSIRPDFDDHGHIDALIVEGYDISERRRVAHALRQSEARFRLSFDHSPIGMAVTGLDGRCLMANRALSELVGYPRIQLLAGMNFQQITHPADLEAEFDKMQWLLSGAAETYRVEKRVIHRSGRVIEVQLDVALARDEQGEPLHFVLYLQHLHARAVLHATPAANWNARA